MMQGHLSGDPHVRSLLGAPDELDRSPGRHVTRVHVATVSSASRTSRATMISSAAAGMPLRPRRMETKSLVHHATREERGLLQ